MGEMSNPHRNLDFRNTSRWEESRAYKKQDQFYSKTIYQNNFHEHYNQKTDSDKRV